MKEQRVRRLNQIQRAIEKPLTSIGNQNEPQQMSGSEVSLLLKDSSTRFKLNFQAKVRIVMTYDGILSNIFNVCNTKILFEARSSDKKYISGFRRFQDSYKFCCFSLLWTSKRCGLILSSESSNFI
jgi:hypothetical protein